MTFPPRPLYPETAAQTFARWLSDGTTWIGVFENHDLGHVDLGRRVAFPYDICQLEAAHLRITRAPDHQAIGLGWRYLLVAKCRTVEETLAALRPETSEVSL